MKVYRHVWDGKKWVAMGKRDYNKHFRKMEKQGAKIAERTDSEHQAIVNSK